MTLVDLPIKSVSDPDHAPLSPGTSSHRKDPVRFKKLKARSPESRVRRTTATFKAIASSGCISCNAQQQLMNLKAVDARLEPCVECDRLFQNMQFLRMDRSLIHGWGLFATRRIPADQPVIEYTGEIIRFAIVERRQAFYEENGNVGSYIFRLEGGDEYIDATICGGPAKFVNHSCEPNCSTKLMHFDGKPHIVIYSIRDIEPGEELCYDYKLDPEPKEKRFQCMCGSKKCKGWLNWSDKQETAETTCVALYKLLMDRKAAQKAEEEAKSQEAGQEKETQSEEQKQES